MSEYPEVLTLEQAAEMLQVSTRTIQRLAKKGEMPGRRVGGQWRFDREQLRHWLRGGLVKPQEDLSQIDLIAQEQRRWGVDLPQTLIDLQQAARKRLSEPSEE